MNGPPAIEKQIEIIDQHLEFYKDQIRCHPITRLLDTGAVPDEVLIDYAAVQYADSLLWVPMLALLKDRVNNPRLKRALRANMLCEAGAQTTSHVQICRSFIESIGLDVGAAVFREIAGSQTIRALAVADLTEAQIAGWIYTAEALVPMQFSIFRDSYARFAGVDFHYFDEHVVVDTDEHAAWMRESCIELLRERPCLDEIISGIDIGGRVQLRDPDTLYAKAIRINQPRITVPAPAVFCNIFGKDEEQTKCA